MNVLEKILEEIENLNYYPDGMGCGIEDCGITDRYEACEYGWNQAIEAVIEVINNMDDGKDINVPSNWISCSERLPENDDMRFYMCIVENHEDELPMFCQYNSEYGFGFWHDIYDSGTLGFVDTEFKTNDELDYEEVIAWQPLPEPYKGEEAAGE